MQRAQLVRTPGSPAMVRLLALGLGVLLACPVALGQAAPAPKKSDEDEARRVAGELHAILEAPHGAPAPEVRRLLELLREEDVRVDRGLPTP